MELSAEANLEFSVSPAFPRGFLRHAQHGWTAIACPPGGLPVLRVATKEQRSRSA